MLALLLLHANEVVSLDRLIDELWGGTPPDSAANIVQGYVSHLRKALEPGRERGSTSCSCRGRPATCCGSGAISATRTGSSGCPARAGGCWRTETRAPRRSGCGRRLALWRGPALADLVYEPFARPEAERLEELRLGALEDRIDADLALGRNGALVGELRELVAEHPLRERMRGQLMAALYRSGRQAEALEVYRDGRVALQRRARDRARARAPRARTGDPAAGSGPRRAGRAAATPDRFEAPAPLVAAGRRASWSPSRAAVSALLATRGGPSGAPPVTVYPHSVARDRPGRRDDRRRHPRRRLSNRARGGRQLRLRRQQR